MLPALPLQLPPAARLADFCRKWHVAELSLFGSILSTRFRPDSDVDLLVRFEPGHTLTLDSYTDMRDELSFLLATARSILSK